MLSFAAHDRLVVSRSMSAVNPPKRVARDRPRKDDGRRDRRSVPASASGGGRGRLRVHGSLGVNQLAAWTLADREGRRIVDVPGPTHAFVQFARVAGRARRWSARREVSGQLLVFDLSTPATPALKTTIDLGKMVFDPVFTADGKYVWVPVKMTNEIAVIDTATWKVAARLTDPAFKQPHQIVFSADGRTRVRHEQQQDGSHGRSGARRPRDAGRRDDSTAPLVVIDVATRSVTKALPLGKNLTGMGTRARDEQCSAALRIVRAAAIVCVFAAARRSARRPQRRRRASIAGVSFDARCRAVCGHAHDGSAYNLPFLGGLDVPRPQFADIDGDGDLDLFVQEYSNALWFFENTGTARRRATSGAPIDFRISTSASGTASSTSTATACSILLTEAPVSHIRLYRNTGTKTAPAFTLQDGELKDANGAPMFMDRQNIPAIARSRLRRPPRHVRRPGRGRGRSLRGDGTKRRLRSRSSPSASRASRSSAASAASLADRIADARGMAPTRWRSGISTATAIWICSGATSSSRRCC